MTTNTPLTPWIVESRADLAEWRQEGTYPTYIDARLAVDGLLAGQRVWGMPSCWYWYDTSVLPSRLASVRMFLADAIMPREDGAA